SYIPRPPPPPPLFPYTTLFRSPHGLDRVCSELPAQSRDEDLHGVGIAVRTLGVNVIGQLGRRHDAAAVVHEVRQHAILVTGQARSEEHTSELQSLAYLVCRLLL